MLDFRGVHDEEQFIYSKVHYVLQRQLPV